MAFTSAGNVYISSTNGDTLSGPYNFRSVRVVAGGSGITVNIKKTNSSGATMYTKVLSANADVTDLLPLKGVNGLYVNISAGSGTVYLYSK